MRIIGAVGSMAVLGGCALATAGCGAWERHAPRHHALFTATVSEHTLDRPVDRAYANLLTMLRHQDFAIQSKEQAAHSAQVRAARRGRQYVFDLRSMGEGSVVRLEIDQPGNQTEAGALLGELAMFP